MISVNDLKAWLREAKKGDQRIYYVGFLAADRYRPVVSAGRLTHEDPIEPVHSIGLMMNEAQRWGLVELYQKRLGDFEYQYIARKL